MGEAISARAVSPAPLRIGGVEVEPGSRRTASVRALQLADGSWVEFPMVERCLDSYDLPPAEAALGA